MGIEGCGRERFVDVCDPWFSLAFYTARELAAGDATRAVHSLCGSGGMRWACFFAKLELPNTAPCPRASLFASFARRTQPEQQQALYSSKTQNHNKTCYRNQQYHLKRVNNQKAFWSTNTICLSREIFAIVFEKNLFYKKWYKEHEQHLHHGIPKIVHTFR